MDLPYTLPTGARHSDDSDGTGHTEERDPFPPVLKVTGGCGDIDLAF